MSSLPCPVAGFQDGGLGRAFAQLDHGVPPTVTMGSVQYGMKQRCEEIRPLYIFIQHILCQVFHAKIIVYL